MYIKLLRTSSTLSALTMLLTSVSCSSVEHFYRFYEQDVKILHLENNSNEFDDVIGSRLIITTPSSISTNFFYNGDENPNYSNHPINIPKLSKLDLSSSRLLPYEPLFESLGKNFIPLTSNIETSSWDDLVQSFTSLYATEESIMDQLEAFELTNPTLETNKKAFEWITKLLHNKEIDTLETNPLDVVYTHVATFNNDHSWLLTPLPPILEEDYSTSLFPNAKNILSVYGDLKQLFTPLSPIPDGLIYSSFIDNFWFTSTYTINSSTWLPSKVFMEYFNTELELNLKLTDFNSRSPEFWLGAFLVHNSILITPNTPPLDPVLSHTLKEIYV